MWSEIVREPQFCFEPKGYFCEATSFLLVGKNLQYLTGVLNSKLFTYIFKAFYAGGGLGTEGYRYKKKFLIETPIPKITPANQALATQIETLVDKILALKKNTTGTGNTQADTAALEAAIDELVFELYELTEEERKIILQA